MYNMRSPQDNISITLVQKLKRFSLDANKNTGFSLIEMIAVLLMVGILSALSLNSWLAFLNKQELNKANDVVLVALRQAQQEAKRKKVVYSVSFINDTTGTPQYVVYARGSAASPTLPSSSLWKPLLADLNAKTRQLVLASNLTAENTANSSAPTPVAQTTFPPTTAPNQTISFDYTGDLYWQSSTNTNISTTQTNNLACTGSNTAPVCQGLIISLQSNGGLQRCVIIKTLLGAMQPGKDSQCNT